MSDPGVFCQVSSIAAKSSSAGHCTYPVPGRPRHPERATQVDDRLVSGVQGPPAAGPGRSDGVAVAAFPVAGADVLLEDLPHRPTQLHHHRHRSRPHHPWRQPRRLEPARRLPPLQPAGQHHQATAAIHATTSGATPRDHPVTPHPATPSRQSCLPGGAAARAGPGSGKCGSWRQEWEPVSRQEQGGGLLNQRPTGVLAGSANLAAPMSESDMRHP